jgi:UDP-glucose 4-epimerase
MFANKTLLITGGTGSFGNAVLRRFLNSDLREIRIFSRDEKKQDDMRKRYASDKLKFYIGDVRDPRSVSAPCAGWITVFHAAALKQVPSCEFHPMEAVRTNVLGTENVLRGGHRVRVCGACLPQHRQGRLPHQCHGHLQGHDGKGDGGHVAQSGGLGHGHLRHPLRQCDGFARFGDPAVRRSDAGRQTHHHHRSGHDALHDDLGRCRRAGALCLRAWPSGDIFVQKAPAATMQVLARAILDLMQRPDHEIRVIGTRHGEKLYEALLSREERAAAQDLGGYFRVPPDGRDLNYGKFFDQGEPQISLAEDYNSHNTERLDPNGMKSLLLKLDFMRRISAGQTANPED